MLSTYDPGAKAAGVALWDDGELACAWLARGSDWRSTALDAVTGIISRVPIQVITTYVVEVPQVYTQRKQKGDPNDLIIVALNAGVFMGAIGEDDAKIITVRPHVWKGQVPKKIAVERFKKRLSHDERMRIEKAPASLMHNVWDAVGLGLYRMGR